MRIAHTAIIVLLSLGLAACGYTEVPIAEEQSSSFGVSKSSQQNLKQYTSSHYGFEFSYPADWIKDAEEFHGEANSVVSFFPGGDRESPASLAVWSGISIDHGIEGAGPECGKSNLTIMGIPVEKEVRCGLIEPDTGEAVPEKEEFRLILIYFAKGDINIGLEFTMEDAASYHLEKEVLDTVVSTFRFIR